jgi:hypothetical protein
VFLESGGGWSEVGGLLTDNPDSFTNEAVTMKKISMMKTTSSMGVMSIADSSSSLRLLPNAMFSHQILPKILFEPAFY